LRRARRSLPGATPKDLAGPRPASPRPSAPPAALALHRVFRIQSRLAQPARRGEAALAVVAAGTARLWTHAIRPVARGAAGVAELGVRCPRDEPEPFATRPLSRLV